MGSFRKKRNRRPVHKKLGSFRKEATPCLPGQFQIGFVVQKRSRQHNELRGPLVAACLQMPEIRRFFGIVIRMYFDDHNPPHFHPFYGGSEAQFGIEPIAMLNGVLPSRAASMVLEWAALHQRELMQNWRRLHNEEPVERIEPLQ